MEKRCCLLCFFYRFNERDEPICCKLGKNLKKKLEKQLEQLAERCQSFREDASFSRLDYPIGVTPEEQEKARKAAILAALKEE